MSEFDFLKDFGKGMGRDRLHHPDEAQWHRTAARLDALDAANRRRRRALAWVFPLAAAASFAWLAAAFWESERQSDGLRGEVAVLKASVEELKKSATGEVHRATFIQYDTVYRTVVIRRFVEELTTGGTANALPTVATSMRLETSIAPATAPALFSEKEKAAAAQLFEKKGAAQPPVVFEKDRPAEPTALSEKEKAAAPPGFDEKEKPADPLGLSEKAAVANPQSVIRNPQSTTDTFAMTPAPAISTGQMIVRRFRSPDFSLAGRATFLNPITEKAAGESYTFGLALEKAVGGRLHLGAAADFGQLSFRVAPTKLADSGLPVPVPLDPNDELRRVVVGQPIWDFSLGTRYVFIKKRRWQHSITAAWVGELAGKRTIKYDYLNALTEDKSQFRTQDRSAYFNGGGAQLGLGFDWGYRHWSVGGSGFYQRQFAARDPLLAERFGLRGAVRYAF